MNTQHGQRVAIRGKSAHVFQDDPSHLGASLKFRSVTQSVAEAIVISDAKGKIIFWNAGAETIFGYRRRAIVGRPLALLIPAWTHAFRAGKLETLLLRQAAPKDGRPQELSGVHQSGRLFPVELSLLTWTFDRTVFFTTIIRDITERKRLRKEILEISERGQQRIGQDLHDDLCQQLTAITLLTEVLEKKLPRSLQGEKKDAREIHDLTAKAIIQTRLLAKGLLPLEISQDGLMTALESLAANTEALTHISCRTEGKNPVLIRDGTVAVHLYRIAQEAVSNAAKHANAQHIVIKLSEVDGRVILSISDDGMGVKPRAAKDTGLGLSIMNSRAKTINGTLHIRRRDQGGTIVTCTLQSSKARMKPLIPRSAKRGL